MPSSLIFAGLVVLWLLILVPAVARRQQEVARVSPAVLSGRVLERPLRHRLPEVDGMERRDDGGATTVGELVEKREDVPSPRDRVDDRFSDEHDLDRELDRDFHDEEPDDEDAGRPALGSRALRDDAVHDGAARDGAARDGVERDGAARDGVERDGAVRDDREHDDEFPDEDPADEDRHADEDVADPGDTWDDEPHREPVARYRPGRGGFDPQAAAAAAHAKYAFRQRVVLGLLALLLVGAVLALLVATVWWWVAGVAGLALGGYLTYLRRQVRIEESIRRRRTERLAAPRRDTAGSTPAEPPAAREGTGETAVEDDEDEDWTADDGEPSRVRGTGAPLGVLSARRTVEGPGTEHESSLPLIRTAPTPPVPAGTTLVDVDDEEQLDAAVHAEEHRRAAGE